MLFKSALITVTIFATTALTFASMRPLPLDGDWHVTVFMLDDGSPVPDAWLKGSVATIKDGNLTFRLSQPSVFDNVQPRLEFVEHGLLVFSTTTGEADAAGPGKGTWALTPDTFQFCFATDEHAERPDLRAGDGLFYIQLDRIRSSDQ